MPELIRDVLYLIFKELQDDDKTLCSCLLVNKTFCEIIIPILWKNPWKFIKKEKEKFLLNVIISHLSDESKNYLSQHNFLINSYHRPLFDYINFCKHLNLNEIQRIINMTFYDKPEMSIFIVENEILNIFINENMKYTHLYMPDEIDFQINLIPGAESCFSEIEFLSCSNGIDDSIVAGLTEICKSIKELELDIKMYKSNYGIARLIEAQRKLLKIDLTNYMYNDVTLDNSLSKHVNAVQYLRMNGEFLAEFLPFFVNLRVLDLDCSDMEWYYLENYLGENYLEEYYLEKNISLPFLRILRSSQVSTKFLTYLINNTSGYLDEIKIEEGHNEIDNKKIIQAIYQNCPNLRYLRLLIRNINILELQNLLMNCQYLVGLYLIIDNEFDAFGLDNLFKVLTKSSPTYLYRLGFDSAYKINKLESFKRFFSNWKGRHPMILKLGYVNNTKKFSNLIEKYKAKGVIKKYENSKQFVLF